MPVSVVPFVVIFSLKCYIYMMIFLKVIRWYVLLWFVNYSRATNHKFPISGVTIFFVFSLFFHIITCCNLLFYKYCIITKFHNFCNEYLSLRTLIFWRPGCIPLLFHFKLFKILVCYDISFILTLHFVVEQVSGSISNIVVIYK